MRKIISKADLSESRQCLIELMQELNYGRIHLLHVAAGDPVLLDPPPRVVREVKPGADNAPRPERGKGHFLLKSQLVEMFAWLDRLGDGVVELIEVKGGLPFRLLIPEVVG